MAKKRLLKIETEKSGKVSLFFKQSVAKGIKKKDAASINPASNHATSF